MSVITDGVGLMGALGCVTLCVSGVAAEVFFGRLSFGNVGGVVLFQVFLLCQ